VTPSFSPIALFDEMKEFFNIIHRDHISKCSYLILGNGY
jgi:hypothetical protein